MSSYQNLAISIYLIIMIMSCTEDKYFNMHSTTQHTVGDEYELLSSSSQSNTEQSELVCIPGTMSYHANGTLKKCVLDSDYIYSNNAVDDKNVLCRGQSEIEFYDNSILKQCTLEEEFKINNTCICTHKSYSIVLNAYFVNHNDRRQSIYFYENGNLEYCFLERSTCTIDGHDCTDTIFLYDDGSLKACNIGGYEDLIYSTIHIEGIECLSYYVSFHKNGSLKYCKISDKEQKVSGIQLPAHTVVWMNQDKKIHLIYLQENFVFNSIPCKMGFVNFYENGKVKRCTLSENIEINSVLYEENDELCLDEYGEVSDCSD